MNEKVVVVGMGYVGLNLSRELVSVGYKVTGLDSNPTQIVKIQDLAITPDILATNSLINMFESGFRVTDHPEVLLDADFIFICVPTPLDIHGNPDTSAIEEASHTILKYSKIGVTVVLESTSYPGSTEEIVVATLESEGLKSESDFYVGFSSERVDPGNKVQSVRNTPKVLAARSEEGMKRMLEVYERIVDTVVPTFHVKEAELSKLIENSYRLINISFINELARISEHLGIDLTEAIRLSATKGFGFQSFWPSAGIGGHCIPVDPVFLDAFLTKRVEMQTSVLRSAIEANQKNLGLIVDRILEIQLGHGQDLDRLVVIAGVTYKKNSSDLRESPGVQIVEKLLNQGVNVRILDPLAPDSYLPELRLNVLLDENKNLLLESTVVVTQLHDEIDSNYLLKNAKIVLDCTHTLAGPNVIRI